jgi:diguanylate cyclase (GGDEF)-like protein/PAS domain S-box-containing protein
MFKKTSALPVLIASVLGGIMAIFTVSLDATHKLRAFLEQENASMERSAMHAAGYVQEFVERRRGIVESFAREHAEELDYIANNPQVEEPQKNIRRLLEGYFPRHFTFVVRRSNGDFVPDDLGEFVGDACRHDMNGFAKLLASTHTAHDGKIPTGTDYHPIIHPQPFNYHFDIIAAWTAANGNDGLLMISFTPKELVQILKAHELPHHKLVVLRNDQPDLIEVTSSGWRENIEREIRLSNDETKALVGRTPIVGTQWNVGYVPSHVFLTTRENNILNGAVLVVAVIAAFILLIVFWYFFSANARRSDAVEKAKLLRQSNRDRHSLETVINVIPIPIFRRNPEGLTDLVNQAYADLLGLSILDIKGKSLADIYGEDTARLIDKNDAGLLQTPNQTQVYERRVTPLRGGHPRDVVFHKTTMVLDGDKAPSILGAAVDVTEDRSMRASLEKLATTDPLTGICNRRKFTETATVELERARRYGHALSIVILDVDHFKSVNDNHGHDFGDAALRQLAQILTASIRDIDLAARIGGEEFTLLLPETDAAAAHAVCERLRGDVANQPVVCQNKSQTITVSLGVVTWYPGIGQKSLDTLMSTADSALYQAKHAGRNRTVSMLLQTTKEDAETSISENAYAANC